LRSPSDLGYGLTHSVVPTGNRVPRPLTFVQAAEEVLRHFSPKAVHAADIVEAAIREGLIETYSANPSVAMVGRLDREINRRRIYGERELFRKVAPATYILSPLLAPTPDGMPPRLPSAARMDNQLRQRQTLSFLEAAEEVLRQCSPRPMRVEQIVEVALHEGLLQTNGRTPANTMASRLYVDINRRREANEPQLFQKVAPATYILARSVTPKPPGTSPKQPSGVRTRNPVPQQRDTTSVVRPPRKGKYGMRGSAACAHPLRGANDHDGFEKRPLVAETGTSPTATREGTAASSEVVETRRRLDEAENALITNLVAELKEVETLAEAYARENAELRERAHKAEQAQAYLRDRLRSAARESAESASVDDVGSALIQEIEDEIRGRGEVDGSRRRPFTVGAQFVPTMEAHGVKYRSKVIKACADVALNSPALLARRDDHPLRLGEGANDSVRTRARDGAEARRCSIEQGTAAARRVHYWVTPAGPVEFASVNVHDDMNIPD